MEEFVEFVIREQNITGLIVFVIWVTLVIEITVKNVILVVAYVQALRRISVQNVQISV